MPLFILTWFNLNANPCQDTFVVSENFTEQLSGAVSEVYIGTTTARKANKSVAVEHQENKNAFEEDGLYVCGEVSIIVTKETPFKGRVVYLDASQGNVSKTNPTKQTSIDTVAISANQRPVKTEQAEENEDYGLTSGSTLHRLLVRNGTVGITVPWSKEQWLVLALTTPKKHKPFELSTSKLILHNHRGECNHFNRAYFSLPPPRAKGIARNNHTTTSSKQNSLRNKNSENKNFCNSLARLHRLEQSPSPSGYWNNNARGIIDFRC
jgi:hypothetical protein